MSFSTITSEDTDGLGNVGQPDTPDLTTTEMQELLDSLPNMIIDKFNEHIEELEATTAAAYIGASVPSTLTASANIQSIITAMASRLNTAYTNNHTHSNKDVLDTITETNKTAYDSLVNVLGTIDTLQSTLTSSSTAIPTSAAIVSYVASANISTRAANAAWPVGSVYSTTLSTTPDSILGVGTWTLLDEETVDTYTISRYVRTE